jgi:uncharacterized membrane protein
MSSHPDRTARGLGWASLALAVPQLLAPSRFADAVGLSPGDDDEVVAAVGVRELVAAGGLLSGKGTGLFLWSRVLGDAMDLSVLRARGDGSTRNTVAQAAVVLIGLADLRAATRHSRTGSASPAPIRMTAATTVNRPPQEVYDFWRGLERLPTFMHHLESVEWVGEGRTRWSAAAPLAGKVSWEAELTEDRRGERLAWRSLPGSTVWNEGDVEFTPAPGGRGTEVRVHLAYAVPGGRAGRAFARLFGEEPHQQVEDDLRRCKQVMETGEVVRSSGSPEGHSASRQLFQRPAQPVG